MSTNQEHDAAREPRFDGVRAIAFLAVLLVHSEHNCGADFFRGRAVEVLYAKTMWQGVRGVDLFFVLSGFLITGILLAAKGAPGYYRRFYARRTLRIFPLYYAALLALFVVGRPFAREMPGYADLASHQAWYWLYAQNWLGALRGPPAGNHVLDHFWTLAIEEQFYLVWPMIVAVLRPRALAWTCVALVVGSPLLRVGLAHAGIDAFAIRQMTFTNLDALAVGALAAIAVRERGAASLARLARRVAAACAVYVAASFAVLHTQLDRDPFAQTACVVGFATALIAILGSDARGLTSRALAWGPLCAIGRLSYGLYVVHAPLILALSPWWVGVQHLPPIPCHLAFTAIVLALSVAVASASWMLLEKPCLRLKRLVPMPAPAERAAVSSAAQPSAAQPSVAKAG